MYLEHFIVVPENQTAYDAAMDILSGNSSETIVWLHGPSGMGKSHLLHGLSHALREKYPDKTIYTCTAKALADDIYMAVKDYSPYLFEKLSDTLSQVDYLLLDSLDYQEFKHKAATLSLMNDSFKEICQRGGKVFLVSTSLPPDETARRSFIGKIISRMIPMEHSPELLRRYGQQECLGLGIGPTQEMLKIFSLMSSCREIHGFLLNEALLRQMNA